MKKVLLNLIPRSIKNLLRGWWERRRYDLQFLRSPSPATLPVIILQPGKVGSMSLFRSLQKTYKGPVIHSHTFANKDDSYSVRKLVKWHQSGKPFYVISFIREPISRNVSAFFEIYEHYMGVHPRHSKHTVQELKSIFLRDYDHNGGAIWYRQYLESTLGIFPTQLPVHAPGYLRTTAGNIEFLMLKAELHDHEKIRLVKDFLGIAELNLVNINIAEKKDYATQYAEFKKTVRFSSEHVEALANCPYTRHFYNDHELNEMRRKWLQQEKVSP